jgi:hypothetical protein
MLDVPGVRLLVEKSATARALQPVIMNLLRRVNIRRWQVTHSNAGS